MNPNNPMGSPQQVPPSAQQVPPEQAGQAARQPFMQQAPTQGAGVNRLADNLGNQHVKVGKVQVDYASLVTLAGVVVAIIASFVPFLSVSLGSINAGSQNMVQGATAPLGWLLLISFVAIGVLAACRQRTAALTSTVYTTLLSVFFIATASRIFGTSAALFGNFAGGVRVRYGAGMWLLVIAIILMLIGTVFSYYNGYRERHGQGTPAPAPAAPAGEPYRDNGWQFGVPAPTAPGSADRSNWQFGVPNAATAAADGMPPMPQAPVQQAPAQPAFTQPAPVQPVQPVQPAPVDPVPQAAQPTAYDQRIQYTAATPDAAVTVESDVPGDQPATGTTPHDDTAR